jgi:hypothetical protein
MHAALALAAALATSQAASQSGGVIGPDAFEALAEGRTLHFTLDGMPFGTERFYPGRRSLWRFEGQACDPGVWYGSGEAICFVYETEPGPQCWLFRSDGAGYSASLVENGVETGFVLDLEQIDDAPMPCPGPEVGS